MIHIKLILICFFFLGCVHQKNSNTSDREPASLELDTHSTVFPHPHSHGENCGHASIEVNGETVYEHNGEKHIPHAGHVDKRS